MARRPKNDQHTEHFVTTQGRHHANRPGQDRDFRYSQFFAGVSEATWCAHWHPVLTKVPPAIGSSPEALQRSVAALTDENVVVVLLDIRDLERDHFFCLRCFHGFTPRRLLVRITLDPAFSRAQEVDQKISMTVEGWTDDTCGTLTPPVSGSGGGLCE